uniref:S1P-Uro-1 n=1 Tax=Urodacus manicatus TaxID=1330407 RepID=T1E7M6_UROMN
MDIVINTCILLFEILLLQVIAGAIQDDSQRIYQGDETNIIYFPWAVRLIMTSEDSVRYSCTASLITRNHVITAGHCVYDQIRNSLYPVNLTIGQIGSTNADEGRVITFDEVYLHPEFNYSFLLNDVAVLKTKKPVRWHLFSPASTICIASKDYLIRKNEELTSIGWGFHGPNMTDSLLRTTVSRYITNEQCLDKLLQLYPDEGGFAPGQEELPDSYVCLNNDHGQQLCEGDSGGAVMTERGFLLCPNTCW